MGDFIQMRCPSCGGNLQVQENLQKIFCMHCGTELLLKQDNEGVLTPIKARDIQASAKLKEIQVSVTAIELLKSQIDELENRAKEIRKTLLEYLPEVWNGSWNNKFFKDYQKEKNLPYHPVKDFYYKGLSLVDSNIPGYNSLDELIEFFNFVSKPQYKKDKYVTTMLTILEPLVIITEEIKVKKGKLSIMIDQAIDTT